MYRHAITGSRPYLPRAGRGGWCSCSCAYLTTLSHITSFTTQAVEFCVSVKFTTFQGFVECNSLKQSITHAISLLQTALDEMNEEKLDASLNYCYDKKNFKGNSKHFSVSPTRCPK